MDNIIQPVACEILDIKQESKQEYTFKVKTDIRPAHGQFLQLSIPEIGRGAHIGQQFWRWMDCSLPIVPLEKLPMRFSQSVREMSGVLRGAYGNGWPMETFQRKHMVIITGGTGLAPVRSMLRKFEQEPDFTKSVHFDLRI